MTYALAGHQSGYVMRGYKAPRPLQEHREYVAMLGLIGLTVHLDCPGRLAGASVTHWAVVPSLPVKPGEHPLRTLMAPMMRLPEVPLTAALTASNPRSVNPNHYTVAGPLAREGHALLIDDTWTSGGHAQSAVLALRAAGAASVSVLTIARWLDAGYGDNKRFIREKLHLDYDPSICPWTGSNCP